MNIHLTHPQHPAPGDPERRVWLLATAALGGIAAVATAVPFVSTQAPSKKARAAGGPVEVNVSNLAPGDMKTVEWRGQPVWVVCRTPEMLGALQGHDADLADPLSLKQQPTLRTPNARRSPNISSLLASSPTWDVRPTPHRGTATTPACQQTGPVASFSLATAPPSTVPSGSTRTNPRRRIWRFRHTTTLPQRAC